MTDSQLTLIEVLRDVKKRGGFLSHYDLGVIASSDRLRQVLVRTGSGRFLTAAQDVMGYTEIIKREGSDYVRDMSLPSTDPIWKDQFGTLGIEYAMIERARPARE